MGDEKKAPDDIEGLKEWAQLVVDSLEETTRELEPFDAYPFSIRRRLSTRIPHYCERFVKGYQLLMDELQKPHS